MGRAAAILLTAVVFAGLTAGASARATRTVYLEVNEGGRVAGTKLLCLAGKTKTGNVKFLDCGLSDAKGRSYKGTYIGILDTAGRATVVTAAGKRVFTRAPASYERTSLPATTTVRVGDQMTIAGTSITCQVIRSVGVPTVLCFVFDRKGTAPSSYGFGINSKLIMAIRFDKARHLHTVRSWQQAR